MNKTFFFIGIVFFFFSGCSTKTKHSYPDYVPDGKKIDTQINKETYTHPTMRPYEIRGITYHPTVVKVGDRFNGNASWYGPDFHGKLTSNGETYDMYDMTAAHKTLPMNTIVKVTNTKNSLSTVVRINDRGPFVATRIIDLSNSAARKIDMLREGTAPVVVEVLGFDQRGRKTIPTMQELHDAPQDISMEGFAIQIGAFTRVEGALLTQKKYDNKDGYSTIIKDVETNKGRLFRVWLKGFRSEQEARDYIALGHFVGSFVVKED
ncbi:MAG: rare lipoprotein [Campylobacterota bacterium]|nr:rare lipoprotein [Campylobacterota bacterium]